MFDYKKKEIVWVADKTEFTSSLLIEHTCVYKYTHFSEKKILSVSRGKKLNKLQHTIFFS